jgi:hypothetical protein
MSQHVVVMVKTIEPQGVIFGAAMRVRKADPRYCLGDPAQRSYDNAVNCTLEFHPG